VHRTFQTHCKVLSMIGRAWNEIDFISVGSFLTIFKNMRQKRDELHQHIIQTFHVCSPLFCKNCPARDYHRNFHWNTSIKTIGTVAIFWGRNRLAMFSIRMVVCAHVSQMSYQVSSKRIFPYGTFWGHNGLKNLWFKNGQPKKKQVLQWDWTMCSTIPRHHRRFKI
jgi:hypothetical protein